MGTAFVARTLLKNLRQDEVPLPPEERFAGGPTMFPLKKLGIGYSILITSQSPDWSNEIEVDDDGEDANADDKKGANGKEKKPKPAAARPVQGGAKSGKKKISAPRYDFTVQFCWQVPPPDTMVELTQLYPSAAAGGNAAQPGVPVERAEMPGDELTTDETADDDSEIEGDETEEGDAAGPDEAAPAAKPNEGQ